MAASVNPFDEDEELDREIRLKHDLSETQNCTTIEITPSNSTDCISVNINHVSENIGGSQPARSSEFLTVGSKITDVRNLSRNTVNSDISMEQVAILLLSHNYYLTALELHTELLEAGHEESLLRDFFSNPSNFEKFKSSDVPSPSIGLSGIPRTMSCQTFDSLDFTRYSDDGQPSENEKLAVIEFELRKAQDTIRSLRSSLTKSAETRSTYNASMISTASANPHEKRAINFLLNEYLLQYDYKLTSVTFAEENDDQDFEDWDDVGLNTSKPPNILDLYRGTGSFEYAKKTVEFEAAIEKLKKENGLLQERLEMLNEEIMTLRAESARPETCEAEVQSDSLVWENQLQQASAASQCTSQDFETHKKTVRLPLNLQSAIHIQRPHPETFQKEIIDKVVEFALENRIVNEVSQLSELADPYVFVDMVARCLPHIVPNILLAKREELVPLILGTACLHPGAQERDTLLALLFNLIKKPNAEQRQMILLGCVGYAKHVGVTRVEAELLPQCWEQLSHKYEERRLLVAEACTILAPYMAPQLLASLVLSMIQQMLQDKHEPIRVAAVESLSVCVGYLTDSDKFPTLLELLELCISDPSESVCRACLSLFLPALAQFAIEVECFLEPLLSSILNAALQLCQATDVTESQLLTVVNCLNECLSPLVFLILSTTPEKQQDGKDSTANATECRFPNPENDLVSVISLCGSSALASSHLVAFDDCTSRERYDHWPELAFVTEQLVPQLINIAGLLNPACSRVAARLAWMLSQLCVALGPIFATSKIQPMFSGRLLIGIDNIESIESELCGCLLPIYVAGVLAVQTQVDPDEMSQFLMQILQAVSKLQCSSLSLKLTFYILGVEGRHVEMLLELLWRAVVDENEHVRKLSASLFQTMVMCSSDDVVASRIVPGLVTLANDQNLDVRVETVAPFGSVIEFSGCKETLGKVYLQLQTLMDDQLARDHSSLLVALINTLGRVGSNTDPIFRNEVLLPRLAAIAATNSQSKQIEERKAIAKALLQAFSSLSCCLMQAQLMQQIFLPALRCLAADVADVCPDDLPAASALLGDLEARLRQSTAAAAGTTRRTDAPDGRQSVMEKLKDANFSKLFGKK